MGACFKKKGSEDSTLQSPQEGIKAIQPFSKKEQCGAAFSAMGPRATASGESLFRG